MKLEIRLADQTNCHIIKNMYPLYLHDLSGIHGILPNSSGIFEEEEIIQTLTQQYEVQQVWFEHPGELFPYLIYVDNRPAGFILIGSGRFVPADVEYYVYETFLLSVYRGKHIMRHVAMNVFEQHHGRWMLYTHSTENNQRAQMFWNHTICTYTNNEYTRTKEVIDGMPKYVYRFEN